MGRSIKHEFRVLLIRDDDIRVWVAQCLDYDIAAQGKSLRDAMRAFEKTVTAEQSLSKQRGLKPFQGIPPAPDEFKRIWETAWRMQNPKENPLLQFFNNKPNLSDVRLAA